MFRIRIAAIIGVALALGSCSPQSSDVKAVPVKDGCDKDADASFRDRVESAPPVTGAIEADNDQLVLLVNPDQWHNLGLGMRQQVIAILDCADAGPGRYHTSVVVRQSMGGPDLMNVPQNDLMQWRLSGLEILSKTRLRPESVAIDARIPQPETDPDAAAQ